MVKIDITWDSAMKGAVDDIKRINRQFDQLLQIQEQMLKVVGNLTKETKEFGDTGEEAGKKTAKSFFNMGAVMTRVGVFFNKTLASISGALTTLGTRIGTVFGGVGTSFRGITSGIAGFLDEFGKSLSDFIGTGGLVQQLGKAVAAGAKGITTIGFKIGEFIVTGIGLALAEGAKISGAVTQILGQIGALVASVGAGVLKPAFGLLTGLLISGVFNAVGAFQTAIGNAFSGIAKLITDIFGGVGDVVASALGSAIEVVSAFADRISDTLGKIAGTLGKTFSRTLALAAQLALPIAMEAANFKEGLAASFGVVVDEIDRIGFKKLVRGAQDTAVELGLAFGTIPDALFKVLSPGFKSATQTLDTFRASARLAAIGNVDLSSSIDTINISLEAYSHELEDAEDASVRLFNATRLGRLEVADLNKGLGLVAGTASLAGIEFDDLLASINLGQRTLRISTVVLGLSRALQKLQTPTAKVREEFQGFFDTITKSDRSLASIGEIIQALKDFDIAIDPDAFKKILPDLRASRALLAIMKSAGAGLSEYNKLLEIVGEGNTAFEKTGELAFNTVKKSVVGLLTSIRTAGFELLEKFEKPLVTAFRGLTKLVQGFTTHIESIDPGFIDDLIQGVQNFVEDLPFHLSNIKDFFVGTFDSASALIKQTGDWLVQLFSIDKVLNDILNGEFKSAFEELISSKAFDAVARFFGDIEQRALGVVNIIKNAAEGILDAIGISLGGLSGIVGGGGPADLLSGAAKLSLGTTGVSAVGSKVGAGAIGGVTGAGIGAAGGAAIGAGIGAIGGPIGAGLGALIGAVTGGITGLLTSVNEVEKTFDAANSKIDTLAQQFVSAISDSIELQKKVSFFQSNILDLTKSQNDALVIVESIQREIARIESDRLSVLAPLERDRARVEKRLDDIINLDVVAQEKGFESHKNMLLVLAEREATERIRAAIAKRTEIVERKIEVATTLILRDMAEQRAIIETANDVLRHTGDILSRPTISRDSGVLAPGVGSFDPSLESTLRLKSAIGGPLEGRLIRAIEDLIKALKSMEDESRELKNIMDPNNLDAELEGLNTRARVGIRRAQRKSNQLRADAINANFGGSTGIGGGFSPSNQTGSLFGFGSTGGPFGDSTRRLFAGGAEGFGGGVTGFPRGVDDDFRRAIGRSRAEFGGNIFRPGGLEAGSDGSLRPLTNRIDLTNAILEQLLIAITRTDEFTKRFGSGPPLPSIGPGGVISVEKLLTGRDPRDIRADVAKGGVLNPKVIKNIGSEIRALVEGPGLNIKPKTINKWIDGIAKKLGGTATTSQVLAKLLDRIERLLDRDADVKDSSDRTKKERAAEKDRLAALEKLAKLQKELDNINRTVEGEVKPVDKDKIKGRIIGAAEKKVSDIDKEFSDLDDKSSLLLLEMGKISSRFDVMMANAQAALDESVRSAIEIFSKTGDALVELTDRASAMFGSVGDTLEVIVAKVKKAITISEANQKKMEALQKELRSK